METFFFSNSRGKKTLSWRRPTLPQTTAAVSSAMEDLTSVFEMGTGVPLPQ